MVRPVTMSIFEMRSTSSPHISTRTPCSSYAGKISTVSPRTRNVPRSNATSLDRKSTRLNSSHVEISYAVFCLKKKKKKKKKIDHKKYHKQLIHTIQQLKV